ncbi:MAG TPA: WD40 repeat domain-containing protein [Bryobacteraceae bacterium]
MELQARGSGEAAGSLTFTSDGKTLIATGSEAISVWDVSSHTQVNRVSKGTIIGSAAIAALSPDAKIVVWSTLASLDVNVLDVRARQQFGPALRYFTALPDFYLDGLAFSPDGKTLASAYWRWISSTRNWAQSGIFLWTFDPGAWARQACTVANRNLTPEEWAQYLGPAPYRKTCPRIP